MIAGVLATPALGLAQMTVGITSSPAQGPFPAETPVSWTAAASGQSGPVEYSFWRLDDEGWRPVQEWSASNTLSWTPSWSEAGSHALQVWVRHVGSAEAYEAWIGTGMFETLSVAAAVTLEPANLSSIASGSTMTWTARATGIANPRYLFWRQDAAGWRFVQDSRSSSYTWSPTDSDLGPHAIQVWAKSEDSSAVYDAWGGSAFSVNPSTDPLIVTGLSTSGGRPVVAGAPASFTATTNGGVYPLEFQFWMGDSARGTWRMVRDYHSSPTYTWWTGVPDIGAHNLQVWVRSVGSREPYDAWGETGIFTVGCGGPTVTLIDNMYQSSVPASQTCSGSCGPTGTALTGSPMTFSVATCGTSGPLEHRFWSYRAGDARSFVTQSNSLNSSFDWGTPGAADLGLHHVVVEGRPVGSTGGFTAIDRRWFTVAEPAADLLVSATAAPVTVEYGEAGITISDTVTNIGPLPSSADCYVHYALGRRRGSRSLASLLTGESGSGSVRLSVPMTLPGPYEVRVWTECPPGTTIGSGSTTIWVRISARPIVTALAADVALPAPAGTPITWTAHAIGGLGPLQYQFWRLDESGWTLAQDYSPQPTYSWTPDTSDAGLRSLQVWVRNAQSPSDFDAWAGTGRFLITPR